MAEQYDLVIKVISQKGTCDAGHKISDEWLIKGKENKAPEGICTPAFTSLYPDAHGLMFGASYPWSHDPDTAIVVCPDGDNPVIFEIRRFRK